MSAEFETAGGLTIPQTLSAESRPPALPLPWSHYSRLLSVREADARAYYEAEAIQGGWSVRQLDRQIATLAFQRTKGKFGRVHSEAAVAHYALGNMHNKVLAREYQLALPTPKELGERLKQARLLMGGRTRS